LTGCISPKSYVDPSYTKTRYEDISRPAMPRALKVDIEFRRNGSRLPQGDDLTRAQVERVLRASGLVVPSQSADGGEILVTLNNLGDLRDAAATGFATGLTFGLAGSLVTDGYEMSVKLSINGTTVTKTGYKHAIHTTIGNRSGPAGLTPTTTAEAFATVVEQMLLNALGDLEREGYLGPNAGVVAFDRSAVFTGCKTACW